MHGVYELKDKIIEELEEYGKRNEVKASELPTIDMLAHTAKNLAKLIRLCEEETGYSYGDRYYGRSYGNNDYSRRSYGMDNRRYGMSGDSEWIVDMVKDLRDKATNDNMRREFDEFIRRMEK